MRRFWLLVLLLGACGGTSFPDPSTTAPLAPATDDPSFVISGLREWALVSNDLDEGTDSFSVAIVAPEAASYVDFFVDGGAGVRLTKSGDTFTGQIDLSGLAVGEHELLFSADGATTAFARRTFRRSHPLYVVVGLGKPTSFRAGGWTAELNTLRSLEAAGYVADTSANDWARMEEWRGTGTLYDWNRQHWASINDTSQPYYPSQEDILVTGEEVVGVLEVPDNGILVDYVTTQEMIEIFKANWDGGVLSQPVNVSIGYHPTNFNEAYKKRITDTLTHMDQFLASKDLGPVVYGRLSDMVKVWKRPE